MTRRIIFITAIFTISSLFIILLIILKPDRYNHTYDFDRAILHDAIHAKEISAMDIKYNSYYIAGVTSDKIYLANQTALLHLLAINTTSSDTQHIRLNIESIDKVKSGYFHMMIDSPNFYLLNGVAPAIFKGDIKHWHAKQLQKNNNYFTLIVPISSNSFALRFISGKRNSNVLGKEIINPPQFKFSENILQKQVDGLFCTDGMMHYNKHLNQLIYIYYYRNQFISMDTSMNILYRGKTIDPIDTAQVEVATIKSDDQITPKSPPFIVNRTSSVWKNWLFVNSKLLARNENENVFKNTSVIDVYNLKDGQYRFSFYLPEYAGKFKDFKISNYCIIALYDHHIVKYPLNKKYFK